MVEGVASIARYQGGFVNNWVTGLFEDASGDTLPITHGDIKSMYPSNMGCFNLSPETVRLISRKPYTGKYHFDAANRIIEVPDDKLGQLTLEIADYDGVTRKYLMKLRAERDEVRKKPKSVETESQQLRIKRDMNALYGYHGQDWSKYGSFLVSIATTAIGRLVIGKMALTAERYKIQPLECDTDGLYMFNKAMPSKAFVKIINAEIRDYFGAWEHNEMLEIDSAEYRAMLLYKMKNYILLEADGTMKFRGSGFHGRMFPPLFNDAVNRFARAIFSHEPLGAVWAEYTNLKKFPLRSFTMSASLNKRFDQYDSDTMYRALIGQFSEEDRRWLGSDISYVKTRDGYVPIGVKPDDELKRSLDYDYYRRRLHEIVDERIICFGDTKITQYQ